MARIEGGTGGGRINDQIMTGGPYQELKKGAEGIIELKQRKNFLDEEIITVEIKTNDGSRKKYELNVTQEDGTVTYYPSDKSGKTTTKPIGEQNTEVKADPFSEYGDVVAAVAEFLEQQGRTDSTAYQALTNSLQNIKPCVFDAKTIYLRQADGFLEKRVLRQGNEGAVSVYRDAAEAKRGKAISTQTIKNKDFAAATRQLITKYMPYRVAIGLAAGGDIRPEILRAVIKDGYYVAQEKGLVTIGLKMDGGEAKFFTFDATLQAAGSYSYIGTSASLPSGKMTSSSDGESGVYPKIREALEQNQFKKAAGLLRAEQEALREAAIRRSDRLGF